jgi:hypothetical protein
MVAAASSAALATPANMKHHPGVAKAWVSLNGTGTPSIAASYNVSSITDIETGYIQVNFTTPFSNGAYGAVATTNENSQATIAMISGTAGSLNPNNLAVITRRHDHTAVDASLINVAVFGDQ